MVLTEANVTFQPWNVFHAARDQGLRQMHIDMVVKLGLLKHPWATSEVIVNGLHTSSSDPEEHITADYIGFDEDGNPKVYRDHFKQSEIKRW